MDKNTVYQTNGFYWDTQGNDFKSNRWSKSKDVSRHLCSQSTKTIDLL
jgi:hypothetical protein